MVSWAFSKRVEKLTSLWFDVGDMMIGVRKALVTEKPIENTVKSRSSSGGGGLMKE